MNIGQPEVVVTAVARDLRTAGEFDYSFTVASEHTSVAALVPDHDLIERIGRGGYGEVWLARNRTTNTLRAVKVVFRHEFEDERPYQREFEGLLKFEPISRSHSSQLAILHVGRDDQAGCFYYVMEVADDANETLTPALSLSERERENRPQRTSQSNSMIRPNAAKVSPSPGGEGRGEGEPIPHSEIRTPHSYTPRTLRSELKSRGRLPAAKVIELGRALTTALAHLHSHGLVHRDIKPANIVYVGGVPKLADIGLVTDASDNCSMVGTEGYIPPEGPGSPQADLYSLGKVLYEAATGKDRRDYPALPDEIRDSPDGQQLIELNAIILRACAADATVRYESAERLRADLELLHAGGSIRRRQAWSRTLARTKKVALAGGALALISVLAYWLSIRPSRTPNTAQRPPGFVWSTNELANKEFLQGVTSLQADSDNPRAIQHFKSAIEKDPNFAEAWARLAWAHYSFGEADPNPAEGPAAAEKAMQLNPNLAYGHSMLATARFNQLKWAEADKERMLAISLDPNSQEVLLESALNLVVMGRTSEALREVERATRASPDSASKKRPYFYGLVYGWCRQYDKVWEIYRPVPDGGYFADRQHALMYLGAGNFTNFMRFARHAALGRAKDRNQVNSEFDVLDKAFQEGGQKKYWELSLTFEASKTDPDHLMRMATIHAQLKQSEAAFRYLKQARRDEPVWFALGLYTNPSFDSLRNEKEFRAIDDQLWGRK